MARINYYFDTELSQYKRVQTRPVDIIINTMGITILSAAIAVMALMVLYSFNIASPKEMKLTRELTEMEFHYAELTKKVESLAEVLTKIENRDDNIYRVVLGAEPIDNTIRNKVRNFDEFGFSESQFIKTLSKKINNFREKLYIESLLQDELVQLSLNRENIYAAIPAIQPISNRQLTAIASGFGMRIHPIYKVIRMHTGIDFAAPTGTAIYATADGQVVFVEEKFDSYGKMVIIDHGFGYTTRYAHLQGFLVKVGQKIKRGEQIGYVGNTGLSTASHLHYEILVNGEQIDPVHYFFDDLSPVEYEKVIELASIRNQSLGN
ncbi:MAG TPA: M23 family metallopeptidase [Cyclobacteriaceae bacterium]|jgi:murein DD-endopeptidase MepM/ murein hydrolase activator NlpD|nr:M23 family metallopeptidase [Cyclobacteriaceae bacterium]